MDAKHAGAFFSLILVALSPFALVCCSRASSERSIDASATTSTNPLPSAAPLDPSDAAPSASPAPSASAVATGQSPRAKCEQIRRNVSGLIDRSRDCTTDADCTQMYTACGLPGVCGISVTKGSDAKIKAAEKPWEAASCVFVTTAPCPTCAMPPAPKCVAGKCS